MTTQEQIRLRNNLMSRNRICPKCKGKRVQYIGYNYEMESFKCENGHEWMDDNLK